MFLKKKKKAVSVLSVLIEDVYVLGLVKTALWLMVGFGASSAE